MADILSRITRKRRDVGHSLQDVVNDVSITSQVVKRLLGTRFNWSIDRFDFQQSSGLPSAACFPRKTSVHSQSRARAYFPSFI